MTDPYDVMGVPPEADEATVRRRYLELVRQFSPEKCPQQFAEIREAYDALRNPVARLRRLVFQPQTGESLDDIVADVRARLQTTRIPTETLLSMADG